MLHRLLGICRMRVQRCGIAVALVLWLLGGGDVHARRYTHEVLPGETLGQIAQKYKTKISRIKRHNHLKSSTLRVGQKLIVVSSAAVRQVQRARYRVRRGDSLAKIAKRHRLELGTLKRLNPRAVHRPLKPGESLWVLHRRPRPSGRVKGLVRVTSGPGFFVRNANRAWATTLTSNRLTHLFADYTLAYPKAADVEVHDISARYGGPFPPHASHQEGRDVDVNYPVKPGYESVIKPTVRMLDLERTWFLVQRVIATGDVVFIFMDRRFQRELRKFALAAGESEQELNRMFEYPRRGRGIIRHASGHQTHFHVRFRRQPKKPVPNA